MADPQLAVELLTTSDADRALELAEREQLNRRRRELCDGIEAEANALVEPMVTSALPFLLAQNHWHHGVIGTWRTLGGALGPAGCVAGRRGQWSLALVGAGAGGVCR